MNRDINIKIKPENLIELKTYLISINEKPTQLFTSIDTYSYEKNTSLFVFFNGCWDWHWTPIYGRKIVMYESLLRQKKLERILK